MSDPIPMPVAPKPWRKRHPVLSRSILYSLGVGVAVLLVVLLSNRLEDDRATELDALQKQLDGLGLVLASDPTGASVLALLDERFADPTLPPFFRGRALRWRAMGWRGQAEAAEAAGDSEARDAAFAKADAAFEVCAALELEAAERYAMQLERTEALLMRQQVKAALAALPDVAESPELVAAFMRQFLFAQARRLQGRTDEACEVLRGTLRGIEGTLDGSQESTIGGREWTLAQIAVVIADFVTSQGGKASDADLWIQLRTLGAEDYEVQKSAALGLMALGSASEALTSWRNARRLDGRLATIDASRETVLRDLDESLRSR